MAEHYNPVRLHLHQDMGNHGPSLAERLSERLDQLRFSSPLHKLHLKGKFPLKLLAVPFDPIPGDSEAGACFRRGELSRFGHTAPIATPGLADENAPAAWRQWVHGWGWLRDLRAVGPIERSEAALSKRLAHQWLTQFPDYDPVAWAPGLTGRRILMAACYAPFLMPGVDHIHRSMVLNSIARWTRHLRHATSRLLPGMARLEAAAGFLGGALILPGHEDDQLNAELLLEESFFAMLPDGKSILTRSPRDLAEAGDLLLALSHFYKARRLPVPDMIGEGLDNVRSVLSALAMGDGLPAAWHGGQPDSAQCARLQVEDGDNHPPRASGYQSLRAGDTRILVDVGPPPPLRITESGHASTLAFQMSDGPQMLIVNCGCEHDPEGQLLQDDMVAGLRSTAGHSTLVLASTNSSRLPDGGPRRRGRVREVLTDLQISTGGQWLEARHDGYRSRFGLYHVRRLFLSPDGQDLRGEDILEPAGGVIERLRPHGNIPVAVRFHLGPGVTATLTEDKRGALLRLPQLKAGKATTNGAWMFRTSFNHAPGKLSVEPSIHIAADGSVVPIQQLLLTSVATARTEASIGWSFKRQPN